MYCKLCHAKENCHCGWWERPLSKFNIEVGSNVWGSTKYLSDDGAGIFARDRDKSSGIYFCVICTVLFVFLCVQYELILRLLTLIPLILLWINRFMGNLGK